MPWGKLTRLQDGNVITHDLLDHMIDVASVLQALLVLPAIRRATERAAGRSLTDVDRARLTVLSFLHDIGKANTGFQIRFWRNHAERPSYWRIAECGHGPQGVALFDSGLVGVERLLAGLPLDQMDSWGEACSSLLLASISHHGRPILAQMTQSVWEPVWNGAQLIYDPAEAIADMGLRIQALYPQAFEAASPELPATPAFAHLFAGLVQFADWLGSDTRESFFPYTQKGEDRAATAPERARRALRTIGMDVGDAARRVATSAVSFANAFDLPAPRAMQAAMTDFGFGPVVVLEAETGSGKTEAALWRFLHLWRAEQVDALYFALPTRAAASQLYERVQAFVRRVWPVHRPVVVRALPGYAAADGQAASSLPGFQVLWSDTPSDSEAERRWAAEGPKRYLAATIAVGTVDQALLGALQIKHAHLRHALLARSLLVVDEVHASDAYMTRLLEHLLRAHVACGGQALLLSATLGVSARTRYLAIGGLRVDPIPTLAAAEKNPFPAISHRGDEGPVLLPVEGKQHQKAVRWEVLDIIDAPERIAQLAVDAASKGARVLVLRNTVPSAIATLKAVEAMVAVQGIDCLFRVNGISSLHHSRFSPQDRPLLDAAVQAQIGKVRSLRDGLVVIGTQTLEQSLDIDADLLITDLCPMDVLLQRVGRLHRHDRQSAESPNDRRPPGFEKPLAWVLTPPQHNLAPLLQQQRHGLGPIRTPSQPMSGVYPDLRVLEATRRLIADLPFRRIPADNRMLVERATHPEVLSSIASELGAQWVRFGIEYDGALAATKTFANLHALPFDKAFEDLRFPDDGVRIGSRIGAEDRVVTFESLPEGPFGRSVTQLAIRHHLLPSRLSFDAEPSAPRPLAAGQGFTFDLGKAQYRYTRFGVERLI